MKDNKKYTSSEENPFKPLGDYIFIGNKKIRVCKVNSTWYFSIIDVIASMVKTDRPAKYWLDFKKNNLQDGQTWKKEVSEKVLKAKMRVYSSMLLSNKTSIRVAKYFPTDSCDSVTILRLIKLIFVSTQPSKIKKDAPSYNAFLTAFRRRDML
jgi:hypothetical protein